MTNNQNNSNQENKNKQNDNESKNQQAQQAANRPQSPQTQQAQPANHKSGETQPITASKEHDAKNKEQAEGNKKDPKGSCAA